MATVRKRAGAPAHGQGGGEADEDRARHDLRPRSGRQDPRYPARAAYPNPPSEPYRPPPGRGRKAPRESVVSRRGHVYKRGDSWTFILDTSLPGQRRRQKSKGGYRTKRDALTALNEAQSALQRGISTSSRRSPQSRRSWWTIGCRRSSRVSARAPSRATARPSVVTSPPTSERCACKLSPRTA